MGISQSKARKLLGTSNKKIKVENKRVREWSRKRGRQFQYLRDWEKILWKRNMSNRLFLMKCSALWDRNSLSFPLRKSIKAALLTNMNVMKIRYVTNFYLCLTLYIKNNNTSKLICYLFGREMRKFKCIIKAW